MIELNKIYQGSALSVLKTFPDNFIDCVVTSPPYWALRDYGVKGQLGLESTFQEYINKLCDIFDEVKRVLKGPGTCWVNMGDTYMNDSSYNATGRQGFGNDKIGMIYKDSDIIQKKSLCMIPQRFAIQMTEPRYRCISCNWSGNINQVEIATDYYCPLCGDKTNMEPGWILRNVIVWQKPNCMPSSASDRFTVDFEYLYFFVKNKKYYFEQQFETLADSSLSDQRFINNEFTDNRPDRGYPNKVQQGSGFLKPFEQGLNKRTVWKIPTQPYPDAHFATYPEKLVETPIKAGCPADICIKCGMARKKIYNTEYNVRAIRTDKSKHFDVDDTMARPNMPFMGDAIHKKIGYSKCDCNADFSPGIVLDPFTGSGTTLKVAYEFKRNYIGIELNKNYITLAEKRISNAQPVLSAEFI